MDELPSLPTSVHDRPPRRTETQPRTDVHDPPVRTGPTAATFTKVPKFSWDMKGDDRPDETLNLGMGTRQSRGTGPALESLLPDTIIDSGTMGVDASTPILRPNHQFGSRSGVRPRQFGHCLTPIPDALPPPPMPRTQLGPDLVSQQQADQSADPRAIIARLQSEIHTLTLASPVSPNPATKSQLVRRQPIKFTNAEVPKFRGITCWNQYRHVFDVIVRSNGWDDDTVALQLLSQLEGDALNVALLVPEAHRATQSGLVSALIYHYGSPA